MIQVESLILSAGFFVPLHRLFWKTYNFKVGCADWMIEGAAIFQRIAFAFFLNTESFSSYMGGHWNSLGANSNKLLIILIFAN